MVEGTFQNTSLNSSTHGNRFIRVHTLMRVLSENLLDSLDNKGGSTHSTDQNNFIDLASRDFSVLQSLLARLNGPSAKVINEVLILSTREGHFQMFGSRSISSNVRESDSG
mmetsp:Transcript_10221/g.13736  ORF Transcript_10221/g.13736 Transcript_10221/m.13736 type:complete len:111 (+) Transcript_10221:771-1103(+)